MRRAASSTGLAADQSPLANPLHQLLPTNRLVTVAEVATALGMTTKSIYRLLNGGRLPRIRVGKAIRIHPRDVHAFLRQADAGQGSEDLSNFIHQQLKGGSHGPA